MTYTLLIYSTRSEQNTLPPETEQRVLARHRALQEQTIDRGEFVASVKLAPPSQGRRIEGGEQLQIMDGPYLESKEWLVGFYLLECPDEASALARAHQICPEPSHRIEVRPVEWQRIVSKSPAETPS